MTAVRGEEISTLKNDDSVKKVLGQTKLCRKSDGRIEERTAKWKYEKEGDKLDEVDGMRIQGGGFDRNGAVQKVHMERKQMVVR